MASNRQKSRGTATEAGMHRERLAGGLFSGLLFKMAMKLPPNERVVPKATKQGRPAPGSDISDAQIAEARRVFEAGEMTCNELAEVYGLARPRMYRILVYATRSARTDLRQPA